MTAKHLWSDDGKTCLACGAAPTLKLSDLAGPDADGWSDVAVFVRADGSESEPFVVKHRDIDDDGGVTVIIGDSAGGNVLTEKRYDMAPYTVRRLSKRGRLVPARIEMQGETAGADLAEQVRRLREALETEYAKLMGRMTCSERFERHGPSCGHHECYAIYRMRNALAATATPSPDPVRTLREALALALPLLPFGSVERRQAVAALGEALP